MLFIVSFLVLLTYIICWLDVTPDVTCALKESSAANHHWHFPLDNHYVRVFVNLSMYPPCCLPIAHQTSMSPLPQVLTILQEVFPAVKAAEMAVKFRPLWWEGWQTLGRAQLNLGELDLVRMTGNKLQMTKKKQQQNRTVETRPWDTRCWMHNCKQIVK